MQAWQTSTLDAHVTKDGLIRVTHAVISVYKSRRREECPPHVFAVAERAWQNMVGEREGQSILITCVHGSGTGICIHSIAQHS